MVTRCGASSIRSTACSTSTPRTRPTPSVEITIQADSIDTRNTDRDDHLRSNDFLAMKEYPEITFRSTAVEKLDDEHYRVTGDLTIRGVTKSVPVDFEFSGERSGPLR